MFYIDIFYITNSCGTNVIKTAPSSQGCELHFLSKSSYHQYSFTASKVQKNEQVKLYVSGASVRIIRTKEKYTFLINKKLVYIFETLKRF